MLVSRFIFYIYRMAMYLKVVNHYLKLKHGVEVPLITLRIPMMPLVEISELSCSPWNVLKLVLEFYTVVCFFLVKIKLKWLKIKLKVFKKVGNRWQLLDSLDLITVELYLDNSCIVWGENCGERTTCLLYDNQRMRTTISSFVGVFVIISTIFDIIAWFYCKDLQIFDEEPSEDAGFNYNINSIKYFCNSFLTVNKIESQIVGLFQKWIVQKKEIAMSTSSLPKYCLTILDLILYWFFKTLLA